MNSLSKKKDIIVSKALFHYLKLEGVTHVFGIPGGGLANLLNAIKDEKSKIKYIICRQETGASYMADGYYRATGNLGVVMVTSGPGATNALTGVMNAQSDGSAVLLITGEVDQEFFGKGYLQEGADANLNINAIYAAATGYSAMISSSSDMQAITSQALRDALSLPRQAVHLSVPNNVSIEQLPNNNLPKYTTEYRTVSTGADIMEVRKALKSITSAKQPLIFLGNGCRQAMRNKEIRQAFTKFVETYNIPVITTADGKGIFPESHFLSLRTYGIASCQWPYYWMNPPTGEYDGLLVLGSSLGELSTMKWLPILVPNGPFIQVDINQSIIGRDFRLTQGIVAEVGAFIKNMKAISSEFVPVSKDVENRKKLITLIKKNYSPVVSTEQYESNSTPLEPAAAMRILQKNIPPNSKLFIDAGNCVGWSVHYLVVDYPQEIFTSLSMGPMGFGVGAVVGGKLGCPEDVCICITGDGAFLMQGSEVSTASKNQVGAIWLVLYDNDLSMVSQGQAHYFSNEGPQKEWTEMFDLGRPDLIKYSEGLGAAAYEINNPQELKKALSKAIKGSNKGIPQVIIANIDIKSIPPYYNPLYKPKS